MNIDLNMKPSEQTPRLAKQIIILSYLLYLLAGLFLLAALLAGNWIVWLKIAAFFSILGLISQLLIARFVQWYLAG